jgi:hypothetical protein
VKASAAAFIVGFAWFGPRTIFLVARHLVQATVQDAWE